MSSKDKPETRRAWNSTLPAPQKPMNRGKGLNKQSQKAKDAGVKPGLKPKGARGRRNETAYQKARRIAWKRAEGLCQLCGDHAEEAHHLHTRGGRPDLIADHRNLICLCWRCHQCEGHPFSTRFRRKVAAQLPYFAAIYNSAKDEILLGGEA